MLEKIAKRLYDAMGLDVESLGMVTFNLGVQQRLRACSLRPDELRQYDNLLEHSPHEFQSLIEAVVVPETWFFRNREAFDYMTLWVGKQAQRQPGWAPRLLSLPSSTGEEPYSLAMALLERNLPFASIEAVDISHAALTLARAGRYGKNSFRVADQQFRNRFFNATAGGYELQESVKVRVTFLQDNLLAPGFALNRPLYDIIFCRNLLIYFDRPTQLQAITRLEQMLRPGGLLFAGPSESGVLLQYGLVPTGVPLTFSFQKPRPDQPKPPLRTGEVGGFAPTDFAKKITSVRKVRPQPTAPPAPAPAAVSASVGVARDLAQATRLADAGHLAESEAICRELMSQPGAGVPLFYLLGLVVDAQGREEEAIGIYRKALYLEPDHMEALAHLAVLLEKAGHSAAAGVLHERTRRTQKKRDQNRS